MKDAEGGCYIAYRNFEDSLKIVEIYLKSVDFKLEFPPVGIFPEMDSRNPHVVSNNLLVPFLVSVIEDFYKSCYIAILKFADIEKKQKIFNTYKNNLFASELVKISNGEVTIEETITRPMSFQNMDKITTYFKELDLKLDIAGLLKKPYRRRKTSLYISMIRFFEQRHDLIHKNKIKIDYTSQELMKDIDNLNTVVKFSYSLFIRHFNWTPAETMYNGLIQ